MIRCLVENCESLRTANNETLLWLDSAFMEACRLKQKPIAEYFVAKGANPEHVAIALIEEGDSKSFEICVDCLDVQFENTSSILEAAIGHDDPEMVSYILIHLKNLRISDEMISKAKADCLDYLSVYKLSDPQTDGSYNVALLKTAVNGDVATFKAMCIAGDITQADEIILKVLDTAILKDHARMVRFILLRFKKVQVSEELLAKSSQSPQCLEFLQAWLNPDD